MNSEILFSARQLEIFGAVIAHLGGVHTIASIQELRTALCVQIMDYTEETEGADADPAGSADNQVDVWLRDDCKALLVQLGAPMYPAPNHATA